MFPQVGKRIAVDRSTSAVSIAAWKDPVTRRLVPAPPGGTRDLHGITVYVPDSRAASVTIAGKPVRSFTRNAADDTERQSITIVDNSTPTTMIDEIPLAANGELAVEGGNWEEPGPARSGAPAGSTFGTLRAAAGTARVRWRPFLLELHNTTHIALSFRKTAPAGGAAGRFFVEIEMADGGIVSASEAPAPSARKDSRWLLDAPPDRDGWQHAVLDVARLEWPDGFGARPPLPLGRVREVRLGLLDARPRALLDVDGLAALRPNGGSPDPEGRKLVGGRVTGADARPVADVVVEAVDAAGRQRTTSTDRDGYYFFVRQQARAVLSIAARTAAGRCAPLRGAALDVRKDEAEVDIDLSRCRAAP